MKSFSFNGWQGNGRLPKPTVTVVLGIFLILLPVQSALALNLFTLWQQPEIPFQIIEGAWVDYSGTTISAGRRQTSLTRIACLSKKDGSDNKSFILEIYPLGENADGTLTAEPGQGVRLQLSWDVLARSGNLMDSISDVQQWQDGVKTGLSNDQWRNDPLISVSLSGDFHPQEIEKKAITTRVVGKHQLFCDSFVFTESDTQSVVLPAGEMTQIRSHVITASVNSEIPFLGLSFITEKVTSASKMEPPSERFPDPIPAVTIEIMELVGFGTGAGSVFSDGN